MLATEEHHARVLSACAAAWRRAGLRCGDAGGPYAYGVHWGGGGGGGGAPALRRPLPAGGPLAAGGGGALGLLLAPPRGVSAAELLLPQRGEAGDGHALQRFLLAGSVTADDGGGGAEGGQFAVVVGTLFHSVVAAAAGAWVAALGARAPADALVSPSGHLFLAGLYFASGAPEEALHRAEGAGGEEEEEEGGGAAGGGPQRGAPTFATPPLRRALLGAIGAGGGAGGARAELLSAVVEALLAVRRDAAEIVALYGGVMVRGWGRARGCCSDRLSPLALKSPLARLLTHTRAMHAYTHHTHTQHQPLALPGAASAHDIGCLRARLLLHLPAAEAKRRLEFSLPSFLFGDA